MTGMKASAIASSAATARPASTGASRNTSTHCAISIATETPVRNIVLARTPMRWMSPLNRCVMRACRSRAT